MKIMCITGLFKESISNGQDKAAFEKQYGGKEMPQIYVTLPNAKTLTQNGAIWRDFTEVGKLMYCSKEAVYAKVFTAPEMYDFLVVFEPYGPAGKSEPRVRSLSELSKEDVSNFIGPMREFLQAWVNDAYGEWVPIAWSNRENMEA